MMSLSPFDLQTMSWGDDCDLEDCFFFVKKDPNFGNGKNLAYSTWFLADVLPMFHWSPNIFQKFSDLQIIDFPPPTHLKPSLSSSWVSQQTHEDRHCMFPVRILKLKKQHHWDGWAIVWNKIQMSSNQKTFIHRHPRYEIGLSTRKPRSG